MFPIVREEKLQALAHQRIIHRLAAQGSLNQNRSAVAHVAGDYAIGQIRSPDVAQRGVHGVHQIEARIDQRTVKIEDHELDRMWVKRAARPDHISFRINDGSMLSVPEFDAPKGAGI